MSSATVQRLLTEAVHTLSGSDTARLDAEVLLQSVLGTGRAWLYAHPEDQVDAGAASDFQRLVANRRDGYPVAYLVGRREFWSLELHVSDHTLIPRPETELLVETGLRLVRDRQAPQLLDLGSGCGAIAIAAASARPDARITGVDLSTEALAVARTNAGRHGITNAEFRQSDWFAGLRGEQFNLILCNPPYVASDDPALAGELRFEPRLALDGGRGGLRALSSVIAAAGRHLLADGFLALEHGSAQGPEVAALLARAGFDDVTTLRDAAGHDRVSFGTWR